MSDVLKATARARFKPGERVRVDDRPQRGHCRTPWYLRGKAGEVSRIQGLLRDPERLAYHRPGLPAQVWYKVRFRQIDIWPGYPGPAIDHLEADLQESWLTPASPVRAVVPKPKRSRP
jgi:nitrile hydratase